MYGGGLAAVIYLFAPMAVASVVLAAWKWRSPRARTLYLSAHLVVSFALILFLDGPAMMWVVVLTPGMCLSLFRLTIAVIELRSESRSESGPL